jgi:spore coat polysaccharide biosynthesis protein SpsF (cytidylyltransferase family)
MGSTRLPGKVLKTIGGKTLLEIHLYRILKSKLISGLLVATTVNVSDDRIVDVCNSLRVDYYRGSEQDVLDRYYKAAENIKPEYIVRLTSDCPLIDAVLIDKVIDFTIKNTLDYGSNIFVEDFPDGQDIEVFKFSALETAWKKADKVYQREHVTPFIRENSTFTGGTMFRSDNFASDKKYGGVRLTVDEERDFKVISTLVKDMGIDVKWDEYAEWYLNNKKIKEINSDIKRNEGFKK